MPSATAVVAMLVCLLSSVASADAQSRSFEGTWVADKQIVVIQRKEGHKAADHVYLRSQRATRPTSNRFL